MFRTVQLSSCISAQGELVEVRRNGDILVRDGATLYRGRPVTLPSGRPAQPAVRATIRPEPRTSGS